MKVLLSLMIIFFSISQSTGQNEKLEFKMNKLSTGNYYVLMEDNEVIDNILMTFTDDVLIDYKIINKRKILFIKYDYTGYWYCSVEKSNGNWKELITSGYLGPNPRAGVFISKERQKPELEYEILEEDKILIKDKDGNNERIFECSTIADKRRAELKRFEESQKN